MLFEALHTTPYPHDIVAFTVTKVESIQPDSMPNLQEIDDGDENPKTRIFVVPIAGPVDWLIDLNVCATITPSFSESEIPAGWTLQGGTGTEKLTRTVRRTSVSKTEFTFTCGGTDSGLTWSRDDDVARDLNNDTWEKPGGGGYALGFDTNSVSVTNNWAWRSNWTHGWVTSNEVQNPPSSPYTNTNGVNQSTGSGLCPRNEWHVTERQNDIMLKDWSVVLP